MSSFFEDWLNDSTHRIDNNEVREAESYMMDRDPTVMDRKLDPAFESRPFHPALPSPHHLLGFQATDHFTFQFPPPVSPRDATGRPQKCTYNAVAGSSRSSPGKNVESAAFNLLHLHSAEDEDTKPELYPMDSDDTSVEEEIKNPPLVELSYQSLRRYESGWPDSAMTSEILPRYQHYSQSTRSSLSRRNSISSVSTAMSSSTPGGARVRQHRPARTQREASILSTTDSIGSRRTTRASSSARSVKPIPTVVVTKKSRVIKPKAAEEYYDSEFEAEISEESDGDDEFTTGKRRTRSNSTTTSKVSRTTRSNKRSTSGSAPPPASKRLKETEPPSSNSVTLKSEDPVPSSSGATVLPPTRRTRNSTISGNAVISATIGNRTFPSSVEISTAFPRLYRNFPISSAFPPDSFVLKDFTETSLTSITLTTLLSGAAFNKSPDPLNLYSPRFVKGAGDEKCGLCPICVEPLERGGYGEMKWLKLKNSSYVYHMSNFHGISTNGIPFSPPVEIRLTRNRTKAKDSSSGRATMTEGKCHACGKWIAMLSSKNIEAVVPELLYWKHAKACHGTTNIDGEREIFVADELFALVMRRKAETGL